MQLKVVYALQLSRLKFLSSKPQLRLSTGELAPWCFTQVTADTRIFIVAEVSETKQAAHREKRVKLRATTCTGAKWMTDNHKV